MIFTPLKTYDAFQPSLFVLMKFLGPLTLPHVCEVKFYLHGENALFDVEGAKNTFYCKILVIKFYLNNCVNLVTYWQSKVTFGKGHIRE